MTVKQRGATISFIVVTVCFALWGFANDVTNPMVKAFSKIFKMSVADGALVQTAFYGGYFALALPAALFIRRYSYKSGILVGLLLFAIGSFSFYPASLTGNYYPFLAAYFILTCGLSFLETSANPYILTLGDKEHAALRINLAQSFNPVGSICGMFVAMYFVQERLSPLSASQRAMLSNADFEAVKNSDLAILSSPYIGLGIVVVVLAIIIFMLPMHSEERNQDEKQSLDLRATFGHILQSNKYLWGFVAQFFYIGAQIMCWTFIIQYGTEIFCREGMTEIDAETRSQRFNIVAMIFFCSFRFVCTFLMRYISAARLLSAFAIIATALTIGVILAEGIGGMYCLIGISACMSLMFPTIYSIALSDLDIEDAKIGAAGQIMAILGGSLLPPLQALIIDQGSVATLPAVNASFIVPMISFVVVAFYAIRTINIDRRQSIDIQRNGRK